MNYPFADMFDVATKAGTLPMQVLMLAAIFTLGIVLRKYYKDSNSSIQELHDRLESREEAFGKERVERIAMLMNVLKEDTQAKVEMVHAVENNTTAIRDLRELVKEQRGFIHSATEKIKHS